MTVCHHDHSEDHATSKRLIWALLVIAGFMVIEIIGGILSGSLALLADAAHMFTDALALGLAAAAQRYAAKPATSKMHFGYRRMQVLAAFANGVFMIGLLFVLTGEAVRRFFMPVEIDSGLMLWVAVAGFVANAVAFFILHRPEERNLNVRGARLHVLGDLIGSVAAILAAIIIGLTGFVRIDPILSLIAVGLIGFYAVQLLRKTSHILLEGAPDNMDVEVLKSDVAGASPDIEDVENIWVWQITPEHPRVMLHLKIRESASASRVMADVRQLLDDKYDIQQSTIQVMTEHDGQDEGRTETTCESAAEPVESVQLRRTPATAGTASAAAMLAATPK